MTKDTVLRQLRALVRDAGSQAEAARRLGIAPQTMTDALRGELPPAVLRGMGLERLITYRRIKASTQL